ncbi:mitochondrial fission ELM1 family protein [Acinetobacter sp. ANC 3813]|uniref:mitochondrial fission ELM1 family protein n=1 Tax=Acinetobacter sp. ANC 3813 TaxID=1977873 RepID=UPI000A33725A|nr:ELM1/GtrOC1 family putative glycosyltransferase [Acinetobacter sp. ANC 3813]OTG89307.1 nucleoside-diphosphate sugar epimerase [Acinetobacter sp. ANC 3813]
MHIVYVSDGKAGHRSQAAGLYKAMQRQSAEPVTFEEISINDLPMFPLIKAIFQHQPSLCAQAPDYIIGVGSHTQSRVLLLGKVYQQAKTVILMKPNFPFSWFNHVIIPEHDGIAELGNVILSKGALNPIVNEQRHIQNRILIALGGSSKRHQWNTEKVLSAIENIVTLNLQAEIILTTSRRTPAEFLSQLQQQPFAAHLQIFPVEQTPQGWIFEEMQKAEAVWVTEDSVSMIYEALTAGCRVGVIEMNRLKEDRITKSVSQLAQDGIVAYTASISALPEAYAFKESDRVATYLLAK